MSKHTVTMKDLITENVQLKIKLHELELAIAAQETRGFWARVFDVFCIKGGAE